MSPAARATETGSKHEQRIAQTERFVGEDRMVSSKSPNLCGFAGNQATIRLRGEALTDKLPRTSPFSKRGP